MAPDDGDVHPQRRQQADKGPRDATYYADPAYRQAGEIYHSKGGRRGAYFRDPNGHLMEILTPVA